MRCLGPRHEWRPIIFAAHHRFADDFHHPPQPPLRDRHITFVAWLQSFSPSWCPARQSSRMRALVLLTRKTQKEHTHMTSRGATGPTGKGRYDGEDADHS